MSVCRDHRSNGLRPWCLLMTALVPWACSNPTSEPDGMPVIFAVVTTAAGIDFLHIDGFSGEYYYVETFGSGAACAGHKVKRISSAVRNTGVCFMAIIRLRVNLDQCTVHLKHS